LVVVHVAVIPTNGDSNADANSNAKYPPKTDDEAVNYILIAIKQCIRVGNALVANKIV
jgi:hypothetical protein